MIKYVFLVTFLLIFVSSFFTVKSNRAISLVMFGGYVLYTCFIWPVVYKILYPIDPYDAGRLYYLMLTVLDTCIGIAMFYIHGKTKNINAKYIGYLSFISAINHIFGRIIYHYYLDDYIYIYNQISISIVVLIITLMIWPIINGLFNRLFNRLFKYSNGTSNIHFSNHSYNKCDIDA